METLPHASAHATLNAVLNGSAAVFLLLGWLRIRRDRVNWQAHRNLMVVALALSTAFLISYLVYHAQVGSVPYPFHDWTRPLYFTILIPHVILAGLMTPFIIVLVIAALRQKFTLHRKLARWVWPVWMFVSITGVLVYLMLYRPWMG